MDGHARYLHPARDGCAITDAGHDEYANHNACGHGHRHPHGDAIAHGHHHAVTHRQRHPAGELVIGHSVAGRPITVTQFGAGPIVRLIVAGIHGGNEWNTTALADELIAHLREQPETVPAEVTLYLLRVLNPDGAARGDDIYARANDNNVDLNRNWPSRWQPNWSRNGCWRYLTLSGGAHAGSEPETQALMQFMLDYGVDAVISYHSAAFTQCLSKVAALNNHAHSH